MGRPKKHDDPKDVKVTLDAGTRARAEALRARKGLPSLSELVRQLIDAAAKRAR